MAALGHGIARIDCQVEDGRFKLRGIDQRLGIAVHDGDLELDHLADGARQQRREIADQFVELHFAGFEHLAAGEGQHLAGEVGALARGADGFRKALGAAVIRQLAFEQFEIADDDGEQVVEVMREAAGQLTDGLHLLGPLERPRDLLLVGHVDDLHGELRDLAGLVADQRDGGFAVHQAAVGARVAQLLADRRQPALDQLAHPGQQLGAVVGMNGLVEGDGEFGAAAREIPEGGIGDADLAGGRHQRHAMQAGFEGRAETAVLDHGRFLRNGDGDRLVQQANRAFDAALVAAVCGHGQEELNRRTVAPHHRDQFVMAAAGLEILGIDFLNQPAARFRRQQIVEQLAGDGILAVAQRRSPVLVDRGDAARSVHAVKHDRQIGQQHLVDLAVLVREEGHEGFGARLRLLDLPGGSGRTQLVPSSEGLIEAGGGDGRIHGRGSLLQNAQLHNYRDRS